MSPPKTFRQSAQSAYVPYSNLMQETAPTSISARSNINSSHQSSYLITDFPPMSLPLSQPRQSNIRADNYARLNFAPDGAGNNVSSSAYISHNHLAPYSSSFPVSSEPVLPLIPQSYMDQYSAQSAIPMGLGQTNVAPQDPEKELEFLLSSEPPKWDVAPKDVESLITTPTDVETLYSKTLLQAQFSFDGLNDDSIIHALGELLSSIKDFTSLLPTKNNESAPVSFEKWNLTGKKLKKRTEGYNRMIKIKNQQDLLISLYQNKLINLNYIPCDKKSLNSFVEKCEKNEEKMHIITLTYIKTFVSERTFHAKFLDQFNNNKSVARYAVGLFLKGMFSKMKEKLNLVEKTKKRKLSEGVKLINNKRLKEFRASINELQKSLINLYINMKNISQEEMNEVTEEEREFLILKKQVGNLKNVPALKDYLSKLQGGSLVKSKIAILYFIANWNGDKSVYVNFLNQFDSTDLVARNSIDSYLCGIVGKLEGRRSELLE
ncbi:MAG: hypothetical protein ON057_001163 [Glomeribacter sp. 1016415]|nr:hypothetical protein [Glomeribacter sp. 1016415]